MTNPTPETERRPDQLSREEYIAKKQEERDAAFRLRDDTARSVVQSGPAFTAFLKTMARMDRISTSNALLVHAQMPNATRIQPFDGWSAEGRRVRKGEKGITTFARSQYTKADGSIGFGTVLRKQFDISQLQDGEALPETPVPAARLIKLAMHSTIAPVEETDCVSVGSSCAFYDPMDQKVYLLDSYAMTPATFLSLVTELAHARLSDGDPFYDRTPNAIYAESVAYLIGSKYGLETDFFTFSEFPASWKDMSEKEILATLDLVRSTMHSLDRDLFPTPERSPASRSDCAR